MSVENSENFNKIGDLKKNSAVGSFPDFYVTFSCFDKKSQPKIVKVHKIILAIISEQFKVVFMQFFYSGKIDLTMDNIMDVTNLVNKFCVDGGIKLYFKFLKRNHAQPEYVGIRT